MPCQIANNTPQLKSTWIRASVLCCLLVALPQGHLAGLVNPLQAGDPPSILSMFRKKSTEVDADSSRLKPEHGPWLILAATLSGENSEQKAIQLANEIRGDLRLASYILEKTFDNSQVLGTTTQLVEELDGSTTQYRAWTQYANGEREQVYAVLVGEFTSTEDPRIKPTLEKIRTSQPAALRTDPDTTNPSSANSEDADSSNWLVQQYRSVIWSRTKRNSNRDKGPMGAAFVTRNPLLPDDFFQAPKIDDFILDLNKQVNHSLLECPGRFTVRVASFYGYASTEMVQNGKSKDMQASNALDRAAEQANKLTLALRERGTEAYQFHDRFGSYVTIGSFDELGQQLPGGGFQYTPEMMAIVQKYCGYRTVTAKDPATGAVSNSQSLNSLEKIPFDIDGKPMAVPRRETSGLYRGSLLGGR